ncbi:hypothetical protein ACFP51_03480 [Streptomyces pratens]|uniref:Uncharacterized protein n=1 Tax=Streptomyces pratens TaxID=887456 RepID=A0ABW1M7A1_9ACTN
MVAQALPPGGAPGNDGRHGHSIITFHLQDGPLPGPDLTWLANRLVERDLTPQISWRGSWNQVHEAIAARLRRSLHRKAVLDLTPWTATHETLCRKVPPWPRT